MIGEDTVYTGICLNGALNHRQQLAFNTLRDNGLEPKVVGWGDMGTAAIECNDNINRWLTFMGTCWQVSVHTY
jgi:hypothetical protein